MPFGKLLLLLTLLLLVSFGKLNGQKTYEELKKSYEDKNENDSNALRHVEIYLLKSKKEKNYEELKQGYEDYSYYSSDKPMKLKYADSAIIAAKISGNADLISSAYLYKGSLYHFYEKNYQSALNEYLNAYKYSKNSQDDYLKYKVIYQMGLIKNYLGYYEEAIDHFNECIIYFEPKTRGKEHPNTIANSKKGYLNSLHQIGIAYRNTKQYQKADSIIKIGLTLTNRNLSYPLEQAYFLKSSAIMKFQRKKYAEAILLLNNAIKIFEQEDDFYWVAVSDFYLGKSYSALGKEEDAIRQFEKVDSIFFKRKFVVPELLQSYNYLISYSQNKEDSKTELKYSKKLLKADSMVGENFKYLSAKIHKDYDRQILLEARNNLEKQNRWGLGTIIILGFFLLLSVLFTLRYYKNEKGIRLKYHELEKKLEQNSVSTPLTYENISSYGRSLLSKDIFIDLEKKLGEFEKSKGFLEKGLTLVLLAEKINTNTSYLSQFINDTKDMNFNKYLSGLRINYITQLMYNDPMYLRLKIQGLADECGISSRQNFSDLFQEINGLRPTDFIKQRKKENEDNDHSVSSDPALKS
ncbi:helix-turn-helix domain-containing protein [Flavobacteriaceae bacterium W22]|nr:helix-turn-helix domain-containing protein [Flavobacteriaceae bacterium W22]